MIRKNRIILLLIISAALLTCFFQSKAYCLEDKIIAVVNDELLTLRDLQDYIRSTYLDLSTRGMPQDQIDEIMKDLQKNGLTKLIEDKLILSKAKEMGIEVRKQLVDERVEEIKKKYGSEQNFVKALVDNGATITDLRNKITDQFKIKFIIEYEIKSKVAVNPKDVTEFYNAHKDDFKVNEKVSLDSLFIADKGDKKAAMEKAKEALSKIKDEGQSFEEVAKEYSDAPSIGVVEKGQFMPEIEDIVFNLNVGEISEPLEVDSGVYIFKLLGKKPAQIAPLEEVKDTIYNFLYNAQYQKKFMEWLDELKKDAYIEIK